MNTLKAEKRTMDVKAKKLRREGYVTGNRIRQGNEGVRAGEDAEGRMWNVL